MSGNLGDIGSIPEEAAREFVEQIIYDLERPFIHLSLQDCKELVELADDTNRVCIDDLSDGEIEGLANLLFQKVMAK
jgi:hypothetical protein